MHIQAFYADLINGELVEWRGKKFDRSAFHSPFWYSYGFFVDKRLKEVHISITQFHTQR